MKKFKIAFIVELHIKHPFNKDKYINRDLKWILIRTFI